MLEGEEGGGQESTYPTDDILMVAQMGLAVFASVDLVAVQVDIVCQTHLAGELAGLFSPFSFRSLLLPKLRAWACELS